MPDWVNLSAETVKQWWLLAKSAVMDVFKDDAGLVLSIILILFLIGIPLVKWIIVPIINAWKGR